MGERCIVGLKDRVWGWSWRTQWGARASRWGGSPSTACLPCDSACCKARKFLSALPSSLCQVLPATGHPTSAFSPLVGLDSGPPGSAAVTCRHKEDAGTQDDVVSSLVELAGCDAESPHEKQNHTQDREDARGPHSPWRTRRVGEREQQGYETGVGGGGGHRREEREQSTGASWGVGYGHKTRVEVVPQC